MQTRNENAVLLAGKLVAMNNLWSAADLVICEGTL